MGRLEAGSPFLLSGIKGSKGASHFSIGKTHLGMIEGDLDSGSLLAGQVSGMVKEIEPVRKIISQIMAEAEAVIQKLGTLTLVRREEVYG